MLTLFLRVCVRERVRMCVCVSHYHYGDKLKDRMGAPGEIAAKKAAEECVVGVVLRQSSGKFSTYL